MSNYIKKANGIKLGFEEVEKSSSIKSLILLDNFIPLCEKVAELYFSFSKGSGMYKTLINMLFLKSNRLRAIAAVIEYSKHAEITEVVYETDLSPFRSFFTGGEKISFIHLQQSPASWINSSERIISIFKWVANILFTLYFLLVGRKKTKKGIKSVIRTWVDDAEKIYGDKYESSVIFIHPFFLNPIRGIKYIVHCFKTYRNVTLIGIPYQLGDLMSVVFSGGINFDKALVYFEAKAMKNHVHHYSTFDIIYASDEYMVNAHLLYYDLMINGKTVINKAHGIGYYSPYVEYSEMHMYNENQVDHYRKRNPHIRYYLLDEYQVSEYKFAEKKPSAIIFIDHGNLEQFNLYYEADLQQKILDQLRETASDLGISLFIKFSPQTLAAAQSRFHKKFPEYQTCSNLTAIRDSYNAIFVNMFSTAYYDFSRFGKILFIETEVFKPNLMFGNNIECVGLSGLTTTVKQIINTNI